MRCVVEGVETDPQLCMLESLGCKLVQGYIFGRPVPAEVARGLIEAGLCAPAANARVEAAELPRAAE